MSIANDARPPSEVKHPPALLDHPQPLGFLPTRRFWTDPENLRAIKIPQAIFVVGLLLVIFMLGLPWWAAGLIAAGAVALMQGLFERYIRQAAKRRFRSRPELTALAEDDPPV